MISLSDSDYTIAKNETDLSIIHIIDSNETDKYLSLAQELSEEEWEEYDV